MALTRGHAAVRTKAHDVKATLWVAFLFCGLTILSCSQAQPIDGFWGYAWGTSIDSVLADTAQIRAQFGGPAYGVVKGYRQLVFQDAQYGLGYGRVTLDFTEAGTLWHGRVRVQVDRAAIDSLEQLIQDQFGRETAPRRFERQGGLLTYWFTPLWFDRDFFAEHLAPRIGVPAVRAIDLFYGGCLTECPLYSIRLRPEGTAYLWSIRGTEHTGGFTGTFDRSAFPDLAAAVCAPDFLALSNDYGHRGEGLAKRGARADYGDFQRAATSVEHSGPPHLEAFLDRLEAAVQEIEWTRIVAWDTLGIADPPRINLDSIEVVAHSSP